MNITCLQCIIQPNLPGLGDQIIIHRVRVPGTDTNGTANSRIGAVTVIVLYYPERMHIQFRYSICTLCTSDLRVLPMGIIAHDADAGKVPISLLKIN